MSLPSRRDVLQGLLAGVGATTLPARADAHPMQAHAKDPARLSEAAAKVRKDPKAPEFLDGHQLETLASLAEAIVPGSTRAEVAPFIDRLLAVDSQDNQKQFLNALSGIEGEAIARYAHPWRGLTEAQRLELLTAASTGPSGKDAKDGAPAPATASTEAPPASFTLRDRFEHLKGWIVGAYYSSEIGMRELGWTGNSFFPSFPGCEHPGGHP